MKKRNVIFAGFLILFFAASAALADLKETSNIGTVKSAETAGKYTYIKLDEQGKEVWLATSPMNVSVGDKVEYSGGSLMKDFHSKSLNKTFDYIVFVTRVRVLGKEPLSDKQAVPQDDYHKNTQKDKKTLAAPKSGEIKKAEGGKTVKEIFAEKEKLKDKAVTLRAKVMKVSKNILGKTWLTLSDGTGASPDNKIIAVTLDEAGIGDVATVKGTLKTDVNLGAGYKYKVLIDEAKVTK
ncbi:MAG: hypothetical protein HY756_07505 [Nitrospirae bacterium]|nr:hypothetical protein [Nitrospirota bacterium]